MLEDKDYQLVCTYLKQKFFISTAYRQASTIEPMWYFETITWEWDQKTRTRGRIIDQEDSGCSEDQALKNHNLIVLQLLLEMK